ncbi:MAG: hypothetical protein ACI83O_000146 [Patescibacteria group bacterium]|jgi:hypothetical protein
MDLDMLWEEFENVDTPDFTFESEEVDTVIGDLITVDSNLAGHLLTYIESDGEGSSALVKKSLAAFEKVKNRFIALSLPEDEKEKVDPIVKYVDECVRISHLILEFKPKDN